MINQVQSDYPTPANNNRCKQHNQSEFKFIWCIQHQVWDNTRNQVMTGLEKVVLVLLTNQRA